MKYQFEQFYGTNSSYVPKISLRNTGQIGLSQGVLRRLQIGDGEWYAQLFFDSKNKAIGIKFLQDGQARSVVRVQKRKVTSADGVDNWSGHVPARAFLDFHGIDFRSRKTRSYRPRFDDVPGMVIVLLNDEADETDDEDDPPEEVNQNTAEVSEDKLPF